MKKIKCILFSSIIFALLCMFSTSYADTCAHHSYVGTVTKLGSCTTDTVMTYKCKYCNHTYTTTTKAPGHNCKNSDYNIAKDNKRHYQVCSRCKEKVYSIHIYSGTTTRKATCTASGTINYKCKYCGYNYNSTIDAPGHDYQVVGESSIKTATESICTTTTVKYACSRCSKTKTETNVDKKHSITGTVTKSAKCTTSGTITYKCTDCGYTYTKTIAATGHNYVNGTCKNCGETSSAGVLANTSTLETPTEETILVEKLEFETDIINLEVNESKTLILKVTPENANEEITYKTSDSKYVTVTSNGKIKAKKAGALVTITATTASGKVAKCEVVVPINSTKTVTVGETVLLEALNLDDVWTSSDERVISFDGKVGVANSAGKCTLTATLKGNNKIVTSRMEITVVENTTVVEPEPEPEIQPDHVIEYEDVTEKDWFADSVEYVTSNELMNGVSQDSFAPTSAMTRGMILTVLYRMHGDEQYTLNGSYSFVDVNPNQYYYFAIMWGAENNIVNGVGDNRFEPDAEVTREQLATILYRYAKFEKISTSVTSSAQKSFKKKFTDFNEISDYAIDSLQWAFQKGIISGRTETTVCPKESVTRAETATMFKRFLENTKK